MATKKAIQPGQEPTIFTNELGRPTSTRIQSEASFFAGVRQQVAERVAGKRSSGVATVSFDSLSAFLSVVTPQRARLVELVKAKGSFDSISTLADALERDRGSVSKDLKVLAQAGMLQVQVQRFPGHGRRSQILPVAQTVRLELSL